MGPLERNLALISSRVGPWALRPPLSRDEVCARLRALLGNHGIQRIILFGSFARGTQSWESDVDLIIVRRDERRFLERYLDLLPILHQALQPHAVEPLIYTENEYESMRAAGIGVVATAEKEGVILDVQG